MCEQVSFSYLERFPALVDVSFGVYAGEKVALLGANGCGKSTLLKILDGLLFPDAGAGAYEAFNQPVTEDNLEDEQFSSSFRQRIGFVFQNSEAQLFSPTVRDEVAFGPLQMGLGEDDVASRIDDLLAMLGIAHLAGRAPYQLSGGEKKRVAIASVLATNPEVLLFDEPTAGLDPRTQQWLLELIVVLNDAGKTIISATHDLESLDWVAGRCLVFSEEHRLIADVGADELLADRDMLLGANLIHEHAHRPGRILRNRPDRAGHHDAGAAPAPRFSPTIAETADASGRDGPIAPHP